MTSLKTAGNVTLARSNLKFHSSTVLRDHWKDLDWQPDVLLGKIALGRWLGPTIYFISERLFLTGLVSVLPLFSSTTGTLWDINWSYLINCSVRSIGQLLRLGFIWFIVVYQWFISYTNMVYHPKHGCIWRLPCWITIVDFAAFRDGAMVEFRWRNFLEASMQTVKLMIVFEWLISYIQLLSTVWSETTYHEWSSYQYQIDNYYYHNSVW